MTNKQNESMTEPQKEHTEKWQWQEYGTTWKGVGLYHITLTIPTRQALLGTLLIPNNDPKEAKVEYLPLGRALVDELWEVPTFHPEIQVLHYCLMPDHLHFIWYVKQPMKRGIKSTVQGFWQGVKKLGRAYSFLTSAASQDNKEELLKGNSPAEVPLQEQTSGANSFLTLAASQDKTKTSLQEQTKRLKAVSASLLQQLGSDAYYNLPAIFTEMPFIRPMGQRRQLPTTIRYIDMNPERLATKRLHPGFFRVQSGIEIHGRQYSGVGNVALLQASSFQPVHVRHYMVEAAEHGEPQSLRDYMNGCVIAARKGTVMVSPFISPQEKQVMEVLLKEQLPFIYLADNGFRDYYKPQDILFDGCAEGRVLILSPWEYDANKRHISRADCVALNNMAEEISTEMGKTK